MRNKYHIIFNLFLSFFALISVQTQVQAQETQKLAPNNIPVPWYSQKITGCPYSHCSLASSLMVFDYFKGMTTDTQRTAQDAEKKLIEYQRNYFLKKRAPFRRRTSIGQGGYYSFEPEYRRGDGQDSRSAWRSSSCCSATCVRSKSKNWIA